MKLDPNKPKGEICGGGGIPGARWEQGGKYFNLSGDQLDKTGKLIDEPPELTPEDEEEFKRAWRVEQANKAEEYAAKAKAEVKAVEEAEETEEVESVESEEEALLARIIELREKGKSDTEISQVLQGQGIDITRQKITFMLRAAE